MKNILIIFLFSTADFVVAQNNSVDTTFNIKKQILRISIRNLDSNSTLLTATHASLNALHDTVERGGLRDISFPDFNKDGYPDILLEYFGNNPIYFLYLFDPATKHFINIADYEKYPDAIQLSSNPKYYYSYQRAGCADMNWVSDLFRIERFKIIQVAHIDAQGCDFKIKENPQVIDVYKVPGNNENKMKLISKLSYQKYIRKIETKWSFIKNYWNKNYRTFE